MYGKIIVRTQARTHKYTSARFYNRDRMRKYLWVTHLTLAVKIFGMWRVLNLKQATITVDDGGGQ